MRRGQLENIQSLCFGAHLAQRGREQQHILIRQQTAAQDGKGQQDQGRGPGGNHTPLAKRAQGREPQHLPFPGELRRHLQLRYHIRAAYAQVLRRAAAQEDSPELAGISRSAEDADLPGLHLRAPAFRDRIRASGLDNEGVYRRGYTMREERKRDKKKHKTKKPFSKKEMDKL